MNTTPPANLDLFGGASDAGGCGQVEAWFADRGQTLLVGLDEAGRGPLAGPVVAAAVALPSPCPVEGLDDSKRLTARRRDALFDRVRAEAIAWGIARADPDEIDRVNILRASLSAMVRAWRQAVDRHGPLRSAVALVDGNQPAPLPRGVVQRTLVKGDSRSLNVAAASILAKVTRDRLMVEYHARWPDYGFDRHKGYPSAQHRDAIRRLGPCPIHRRSFRLLPDEQAP
ncbi:MAG: ribonuclease HII [Myxococcota bacterium]